MKTITIDTTTATLLRSRLLDLARRQDELAADVAAATPYWKPQPTSVHAHRATVPRREPRLAASVTPHRTDGGAAPGSWHCAGAGASRCLAGHGAIPRPVPGARSRATRSAAGATADRGRQLDLRRGARAVRHLSP